ncbi:choice-of-anchor A family protein [Paraglaciecola hydrolytica]|uniref:Choice-of-anchor A domain-containing protein n=1 Tax=Paraglaciecola hydrolytica TaxID=1799789 RepID=A0A136A3F7_9ALTE|nr:choice-of-anchor A family protein [Paraglaciecola hydrolytica]KXI29765.1 hypothetical protein AX660_06925 [Paraglaciecola hydrolytica]
MKYKFLLWMALSSGFLSAQALAASPGDSNYVVNTQAHVGNYNLFLQNDFKNNGGVHIHGKAFVGGDWTTNVNQPGADALTGSNSVDAVTVLGELKGSGSLTINNGNNVVYGTKAAGFGLTLNNTGGKIGTATQISDSSYNNQFSTIWNQAVNDSQHFKTLASTGAVSEVQEGKKGIFQNDNTLDLNVFNINSSSFISNGNGEIEFLTTPSAPVVINVGGTGIINIGAKPLGNFINASGANVLWNFYEATQINFTARWVGSILAPNAHINYSGGDIDGSIVAMSLEGNSQLHNVLYTYDPPQPPTEEVPAPAGIFLIGLGLLIMARRKFSK